MNRKSFYLSTVVLFLLTWSLSGQINPPTNLMLMASVIDSSFEQAMKALDLDTIEYVMIKGFNQDDSFQNFVLGRLQNRLFESGIHIVSSNDSMNYQLQIYIEMLEMGVQYIKSGRHGIFGSKWIKRKAEAEFMVRAFDPEGNLRIIHEFKNSISDTVGFHQLTYIEQRGYILGFPIRPPYSDVFSRIEPALMIGTIGLVTYLFYIIRS